MWKPELWGWGWRKCQALLHLWVHRWPGLPQQHPRDDRRDRTDYSGPWTTDWYLLAHHYRRPRRMIHLVQMVADDNPPSFQLKCSCGRRMSFSSEELKLLREDGVQELIAAHQDNPVSWERYI